MHSQKHLIISVTLGDTGGLVGPVLVASAKAESLNIADNADFCSLQSKSIWILSSSARRYMHVSEVWVLQIPAGLWGWICHHILSPPEGNLPPGLDEYWWTKHTGPAWGQQTSLMQIWLYPYFSCKLGQQDIYSKDSSYRRNSFSKKFKKLIFFSKM